jgi:membrane protein implicated in regulation of membrane protease activity
LRQRDQDPGPFAWLLAFISLLLPWAAAALAIFGIWRVARGEWHGWWYVAAAGLMLIADLLIDFVWASPKVLATDQPDLNRRPIQLVGRIVTLEEAIVHGRGKARIDDTVWVVEGPDAPEGAAMRVTAARGPVLQVERA